MIPLADGSDLGGSLRNPASFCNVVGFRPTPGRVPTWPVRDPWSTLSVQGPLARNVDDLALLLSVMAGPDDRSPISLDTDGSAFAAVTGASLAGLRVGLSEDLGGAFEVDSGVAERVRAAGELLGEAGARVRRADPDLGAADEVFRTLRAWLFAGDFSELLRGNPDAFKPSLAENIRIGQRLSGRAVSKAFAQLGAVHQNLRRYFDDFDVLLLPTSQVPPFDAAREYPTSINGRPLVDYIDWMRSCYLISVTGCPAISVPAGFDAHGLPIGVQLVCAPRQDLFLLEVARAFEAINDPGSRPPSAGLDA